MMSQNEGMAAEMSKSKARIALLIDAENIPSARAAGVVEIAQSEGEVLISEAYGDWSNPTIKGWVDQVRLLGIRAVEQVSTGKKKNSADCAFTVGAMDIHFTCPWVNTFVLATSDGDFTALASYLIRAGHRVVGIGTENAPRYFRASVSEFFEVEDGVPAPLWADDDRNVDERAREVLCQIGRAGAWHTGGELCKALADAGIEIDFKKMGFSGFEKWLKATGMFKADGQSPTYFKLKKEYR